MFVAIQHTALAFGDVFLNQAQLGIGGFPLGRSQCPSGRYGYRQGTARTKQLGGPLFDRCCAQRKGTRSAAKGGQRCGISTESGRSIQGGQCFGQQHSACRCLFDCLGLAIEGSRIAPLQILLDQAQFAGSGSPLCAVQGGVAQRDGRRQLAVCSKQSDTPSADLAVADGIAAGTKGCDQGPRKVAEVGGVLKAADQARVQQFGLGQQGGVGTQIRARVVLQHIQQLLGQHGALRVSVCLRLQVVEQTLERHPLATARRVLEHRGRGGDTVGWQVGRLQRLQGQRHLVPVAVIPPRHLHFAQA